MPDIKPTLIRARELIADPAHWTKGDYAQENTGAGCLPWDPDAYCFCILGAVDRAIFEQQNFTLEQLEEVSDGGLGVVETTSEGKAAIDALQAQVPGSVGDFNDDPDTTHADVLDLLDKAIAAA